MKYRLPLALSILGFLILTALTIGNYVSAQRQRPREDRGTAACSIETEANGRRTAYLDCTNYGTINGSQECTPTHPALQKAQLLETFPSGRQNCRFTLRNECSQDKKNAGYSWACDDGQDPSERTEIKSIICPVSCTRYCPEPDYPKPCRRAVWDSTYCEWDDSRCLGGDCLTGDKITTTDFVTGEPSNLCSPCNPDPWELDDCTRNGGNYDWSSCFCGASPIVIDINGNGFDLTNVANGVQFDINGDGTQEQLAWTSANSDDVWLVLDRDGNGTIDSGRELFGNNTDQPAPPQGEQRNGFLALAEYDKVANGGNGDGLITAQDAVFANLRLWQDANHNGVSDFGELKTPNQLGLAKLDLDYKESRREDENGNKFKYRAKVKDTQDAQLGRWAWDVYLVVRRLSN